MTLVSRFIEDLGRPSAYRDRQFEGGEEEFLNRINESSTLYIGNLSFYTSEEQIHNLFSKCGQIKRIIMGLDRNQKTPCGFCFVEYYSRGNALACKKYLDGMKLDERFMRIDLDPGFREGRQYGRGRRGGQVRDELRKGYDAGRGGWGGLDSDVADGYRRLKSRARMKLLYSSIKTAGNRIAFQSSSNIPSLARLFSSVTALTKEQVEERILGVLKAFDRVNKDSIKIDSKFTSDLGLDSLDVVEVMIAFEEEFHMEIPDDVADKCTTPKDAADYIFNSQTSH